MDSKGSLVDTNLKIYPTDKLIIFLKNSKLPDSTPGNIVNLINPKKQQKNDKTFENKSDPNILNGSSDPGIHLSDTDLETIAKIKNAIGANNIKVPSQYDSINDVHCKGDSEIIKQETEVNEETRPCDDKENSNSEPKNEKLYLETRDIDWLYHYLQNKRKNEDTPYLHELLEGVIIIAPENETIKRNPDLEARCVKLRAQQEAREYRKMTRSVDNVRMRLPEDTIAYQLKHLNRQLIAIAQFILSIFAGFLFGFRGVEWMVGNLDFGFRLLLGVMCALIIALAEIYFLAKKLNEELLMEESVQIGGPPKFANEDKYQKILEINKEINQSIKEHQD